MTPALVALVAAHAFDYLSFLVMTAKHGMAAEANPVVIQLAEMFGLPGLTIAKLASVAFLASVVIIAAPHRRRMAAVLVAIGITAGMVGGVSNITSI